MVGIAVENQTTTALIDITRREVQRYAGYSPLAKLHPILDDQHQTYAVVIIESDRSTPPYIVVLARVVGDKIVIEADTTDKPLVEALLVNGGLPREQIVLAYRGETLPATGC